MLTSQSKASDIAVGVQAIVLDIEGTTTDIRFVHQVLFPYAAQHLETFVKERESDPDVVDALSLITDEDLATCPTVGPLLHRQIALLQHWIAMDKKHTALKRIQGLLWKVGYESGTYQGHVYSDVPTVLQQLIHVGKQVDIYSSGSVAAQQLLFRYSNQGDLTPYFSFYFDTTVGGKKEIASYQAIAKILALPSNAILFLSDVEDELDAAQQAGFQTIQVVRDEQTKASKRHLNITDLLALL